MTGASTFGAPLVAVATGLVATGNGQTSALRLAAQTSIISSAPTGTGVILPLITSGTLIIQNQDPENPLLVYPPVTSKINSLDYDAPFTVQAGGTSILFSTNDPADQWFSGSNIAISTQAIQAVLTANPTLLLGALNSAYEAGIIPQSNTGSGGGLFLQGTYLSFGYESGT